MYCYLPTGREEWAEFPIKLYASLDQPLGHAYNLLVGIVSSPSFSAGYDPEQCVDNRKTKS